MEINYITQDGTLFGTTKILGIGKRKPNLVYGIKAKELREKANISVEELSKEFGIKKDLILGIEDTKKAMTDKVMEMYMEKFKVPKEHFFDLDLEVYICADNGTILKEYSNSEECKREFDKYKEGFVNCVENGKPDTSIFIDFSKEN